MRRNKWIALVLITGGSLSIMSVRSQNNATTLPGRGWQNACGIKGMVAGSDQGTRGCARILSGFYWMMLALAHRALLVVRSSTPTFDSLANNGLRYTNFHTNAICAPTRAALLTGRNQHYVHMGGFRTYAFVCRFSGL